MSIRDRLETLNPYVHHDTHLRPHMFKNMNINNGQTGMQLMCDYYTFAFVRNPWDWQVSLFHYMKQATYHPQHQLIKHMNFNQYMEWRVKNDLKTQYQFLSIDGDNTSEIHINKIGRFERLQQDFDTICDDIGMSRMKLPEKNKSKHKKYTEYYDDKSKKIVDDLWKIDIETFGYNFEGIL